MCRGFKSHHSTWSGGGGSRRGRRYNWLTTIPIWFETAYLLVEGVLGASPNPDLFFIYVTVPIAEMLYTYGAVAVPVSDSGCRPYIDMSVQSTLSQRSVIKKALYMGMDRELGHSKLVSGVTRHCREEMAHRPSW